MKLTKWFDGAKFVPYHVGYYERSYSDNNWLDCFWDGVNWSAPYVPDVTSVVQDLPWRGLAKEPKK